jgi:hypothetical protein
MISNSNRTILLKKILQNKLSARDVDETNLTSFLTADLRISGFHTKGSATRIFINILYGLEIQSANLRMGAE